MEFSPLHLNNKKKAPVALHFDDEDEEDKQSIPHPVMTTAVQQQQQKVERDTEEKKDKKKEEENPRQELHEDEKFREWERLKVEGESFAESGRNEEALLSFSKAIRIRATGPLHEMCAQILSEMGSAFPAVQAAERAVEIDPKWGIGWRTLARCQANLGQFELAVTSFERALAADASLVVGAESEIVWLRSMRTKQREHDEEALLLGELIRKARATAPGAETVQKIQTACSVALPPSPKRKRVLGKEKSSKQSRKASATQE